jgi:hypothetical protein
MLKLKLNSRKLSRVSDDQSHLPLERQTPPTSAGLPAHFYLDPDAPFWRPGGMDLFRHLGWRNLLFLPALGVVVLAIFCLFEPRLIVIVLQLGFKIITVSLAIPIALMGYAIRAAVRMRKEPFCIHCGYGLVGLPPVHVCPECGRPYDLGLVEDYRRDPHWFIHRWRMQRELPPPDVQVVVPPTTRRRRSRDGT